MASVDAVRAAMFFILAGDYLAWALYDLSNEKEGLANAMLAFVSTQMMHADWEGFRFYDFLFPLFIFITGVSIVLSLPRLMQLEGYWAAHRRVLRRSLVLSGFGVLYYGGVQHLWPDIRLLGVLQRIALCYFFASLLFEPRSAQFDLGMGRASGGLLGRHIFVPIPGVGAGVLTEETNLAAWIDANYLPGKAFYGGYDPEGLLPVHYPPLPPVCWACLRDCC
jgi:predicted acyltransferase